jgi:hypothetical protein
MQAFSLINNKGGALSEKQYPFAYDIATCYQMLMQMSQLDAQYKAGAPPTETPGSLNTPSGQAADSPKTNR